LEGGFCLALFRAENDEDVDGVKAAPELLPCCIPRGRILGAGEGADRRSLL